MKKHNFERIFRNVFEVFKCIWTYPDASERIRTCPKVSASLKTSNNLKSIEYVINTKFREGLLVRFLQFNILGPSGDGRSGVRLYKVGGSSSSSSLLLLLFLLRSSFSSSSSSQSQSSAHPRTRQETLQEAVVCQLPPSFLKFVFCETFSTNVLFF